MLGRRLSQESSGAPVGSSLCFSCPLSRPARQHSPMGSLVSAASLGSCSPALRRYPSSSSLLTLLFPQICVPNLLVRLTTSNLGVQAVVPCSLAQSVCQPGFFFPDRTAQIYNCPYAERKSHFFQKLFYSFGSHSWPDNRIVEI